MDTQAKHINVLLVEDEPAISEWVSETLTEDGFTVVTVANARDALAELTAHPDVDVLFTDINLPGGMDGLGLACAARALRPELPVIYSSGRMSSIPPQCAVAGSVFLSKPYLPSQVCTLLSRMLPAGARHLAFAHA